jgi:enoyl-CoA hydratase/carnithine racemase
LSEGNVALAVDAPVATVLFDRPQAHNAMTFAMYDRLVDICAELKSDAAIRVIVFRGAGGKAFISGTDIAQLSAIATGEDGLAYEARIEACIGALEALPQPTVALIDGWAVGGGLALAAACDFRLATKAAKFGAPIARTVGNCYSPANVKRLIAGFGAPRAKRILMLAEMIDAEEAKTSGFVLDAVESAALEARADQLIAALLGNAPLTMQVSKEMVRRIVQNEANDGADLISTIYGSEDFRSGVKAFVGKTKVEWRGR